MNITEAQQRIGLIGWPVKHSVSPPMFNAAFAALGLNWRYDAYPVRPEDLASTLNELRQQGIRGLNVTIPHKRAVMALMDDISPQAQLIGAVNTITAASQGGTTRWQGTNTDAAGFQADLERCIGQRQRGQVAAILGAGGAARAAAVVLAQVGYRVVIVSRDPVRGSKLIDQLTTAQKQTNPEAGRSDWQLQAMSWDQLSELPASTGLIVNCTPVGMWPHTGESPWPQHLPIPAGAVVYDMVYRPQKTRLLMQAESVGVPACTGLGMLVGQGAAAFKIWTGQDAPIDIMYEAAKRALES